MNRFHCPIIGCRHYPKGDTGKKFSDITHLIRHLKSTDHDDSRHLLDHTLCNKIKLFTCTHPSCADSNNIFFSSQRALDEHDQSHHPPICVPIITNDPQHTMTYYTSLLFNGPGSEQLTNNWSTAETFINDNYNGNIPHFRSTWRRFLNGNNKKRFFAQLAKIINAIIQSNTTGNSTIFWWILFHFEMLILAPTPPQGRTKPNIKALISKRLRDFQCGNIETLLRQTTFNTNWTKKKTSPRTRRKYRRANSSGRRQL